MTVNRKHSSKFMALINEYWYIILGVILIIPFIIRYLRKQDLAQVSADQQQQIDLKKVENSDPVKQQQNANAITTSSYYQSVARQVAYNLGVNFAWYDPRSWSENDSAVLNLLKPLNSGQIKTVSSLYYNCYATGRSMQDDCLKLLPASFYNQIKF